MKVVKPKIPIEVQGLLNRTAMEQEANRYMTAQENIQAGRYFTVGNRVFHALKVIVKGETLQPGKNCEEFSIAEALNILNESEE